MELGSGRGARPRSSAFLAASLATFAIAGLMLASANAAAAAVATPFVSTLTSYSVQTSGPTPLIIDTDLFSDADDVGALATGGADHKVVYVLVGTREKHEFVAMEADCGAPDPVQSGRTRLQVLLQALSAGRVARTGLTPLRGRLLAIVLPKRFQTARFGLRPLPRPRPTYLDLQPFRGVELVGLEPTTSCMP
jgi:hypothetical protein